MADQTQSPDDGGNPNAASWTDPNASLSTPDSGAPIKSDAELFVESTLAQRGDSYVTEGVSVEVDSDESSTEDAQEASQANPKAGSQDQADNEPEGERAADWLLKAMEKESKFRSEREAFQAEKEEYDKLVESYKQDKDLAVKDPIAFLQALGITDKAELENFARKAYYESLGELAPDDHVQGRQMAQLQREIAELKQAGKQEAAAKVTQKQKLADYQSSLSEHMQTVQASDFPQVAEGFNKYTGEGVMQDLLIVADMAEKATGILPSAAELLPLLEAEYGKLAQSAQQTQDASQPTPNSRAPKKTIRNKSTRAQATATDISQYSDGNGNQETYDKVAELSRKRFAEEMRQAGIKI